MPPYHRPTSHTTCTHVARGAHRVWQELDQKILKCAQGEIIAQGEPLPKCDIVDTTFHASAATRQIGAQKGALPTI